MIYEAIYELYPSAKLIEKMDGVYSVYDGLRNPIVIDMSSVNQEAQRMEAEVIAQQEAKEAIKTSVINKIATNLTSDEKLWLEENL